MEGGDHKFLSLLQFEVLKYPHVKGHLYVSSFNMLPTFILLEFPRFFSFLIFHFIQISFLMLLFIDVFIFSQKFVRVVTDDT